MWLRFGLSVFMLLTVHFGCNRGRAPEPLPELHAVTGTVIADGKPLADGKLFLRARMTLGRPSLPRLPGLWKVPFTPAPVPARKS